MPRNHMYIKVKIEIHQFLSQNIPGEMTPLNLSILEIAHNFFK